MFSRVAAKVRDRFQPSPSSIVMRNIAPFARLALLVSLVLSGTVAFGQPIESRLDCKSNAHDFIAPLTENELIQTKPMHVEPNSVNAFRPTTGTTLTAYGFKVYVVLGYGKDDPLFTVGKGQPISDSAYGAVVWGGTGEVAQKVREAGSDADVHHVAPFITAIFCKQ
jgi:hypothetical protein